MTPSEFFVGLDGLPTLRDRLPTRVIGGLVCTLIVVLMLLAWTLSLSRGLERAVGTTKELSSVRLMANQIAIELLRPDGAQPDALQQALQVQDQALAVLAGHSLTKPTHLPAVPHIRHQLRLVEEVWLHKLKPAAVQAQKSGEAQGYLDGVRVFLSESDRLAGMIDLDIDKKRTLLRFLQGAIAVIGSVGTALTIYLLYVWIIQPMLNLRDGLYRLTEGEFHTRLPVKTRDEFGVLAHGFNQMADKLEQLYRELDLGVRTKTAELEKQNRETAFLYAITAFLTLPNDSESICRLFLQRVISEFGAAGGAVRVTDTDDGPERVMTEGEVTVQGSGDRDGDIGAQLASADEVAVEHGAYHASFDIATRDEALGTFTLHFASQRQLSPSEDQLLKTLGQHLGIALDNRRLEAQARKLAVTQERSLMAQGLHDSIAQGLNFLKMQLQMLEDALARGDDKDVRDIAQLLRMGVDESYQDVRELLVNFRTKLDQVELPDAIEEAIRRFRRQTGINVHLDMQYHTGLPLSPEQQLQVLFIMQEALSNVRKHAQADHVDVIVRNHDDFEMRIVDNGRGYAQDDVASREENHIGLHIMRERAARVHAVLQLRSQLGQGTTVEVTLPHTEKSVV
ncbi:ATP-binding protein [Bordetella sp. 15P40C-2]|uniref:ATP-binding protein n=1 Tax=Bordetella sp. 15P40C-2 TaxID=2572246 RepID=UPI001322EA58|nr:ATP-binding protein [Bordetella sp. 15P40C-2]MVW71541.1 HAMP domain-containing protein [Bordetella sp. 15P40C-2]